MKQKTQYLNYAGLLEFMHLDHNNTDLFLSHCGMQQCKPGHRFGHSPRPEYHLHFILDGCGTLRYHSEEYHLRRGQIFVIGLCLSGGHEISLVLCLGSFSRLKGRTIYVSRRF